METYANWMRALQRPTPYQAGAAFWTDKHISTELLKEHLRPDTDAASYRPETIIAIINRLYKALRWTPSSAVVDLGCGPGLYCAALAARGMAVTGVDQSENSLRYAENLCRGQNARFLRQSYLEPFGSDAFDAAIMISQDYGVLAPAQRKTLLGNIYAALKPGGSFALDVAALPALTSAADTPAFTWEAAQSGLWRPHPYLTLHAVYRYPELSALCDLYAVLDDTVMVYRIWQTYFTPETIGRELAQAGFHVEAVHADLAGAPWTENAPALGVLCRKR